ncbi:MAG: hypothetical protein Q4A70_00710 [Candidatus Saccharibacteria bacterium]|nr:hypothetical protein [Candidatus Saccharibacteria bacterium]
MTNSPALKYGSKGWEDESPSQQISSLESTAEESDGKIKWHRMTDWRAFSTNLDVDPALLLRRVLGS